MAKKLHVEVVPSNWKRMKRYIKAYNEDENRVTPRIKYAHVINEALVYFLGRYGVPRGKAGS
jgi:hypothetical protein